ncbi:MAG: hypothetical protein J5758_03925, partial [Abditibacteriota bacterium]|nr:hypothetical protein [Abditibacteriota bacterium]
AGENGLPLSTSIGCACSDELPEDRSVTELARMADKRMYLAKARYYRESGNDRRKYTPDGPETDSE